MTNAKKIARNCQSACYKQLSGWEKWRSIAIYRRTEDFVQWLLFETLSFQAVRPSYAIQALATQFTEVSLTIGDFARTDQGTPLYIEWESWSSFHENLMEVVLSEVQPSVTVPLTTQTVIDYLDMVPNNHVNFLVTRGIANIVTGNTDLGRRNLKKAQDWYGQITTSWAREEEHRILSWLELSNETLLSKLREDAQVGATLLKLK
jgi:hypothetical protein